MPLTDQQIDRYSRQIIVSEIGGVGQERLLQARVGLVGDADDIELPMLYLAGAGIGRIDVSLIDGAEAQYNCLFDRARSLNAEVRIERQFESAEICDVELLIAGSDRALDAAVRERHEARSKLRVLARLDDPPVIEIFGAGDRELTARLQRPFSRQAVHAHFVATIAAIETIKLILNGSSLGASRLIEFNGYRTS